MTSKPVTSASPASHVEAWPADAVEVGYIAGAQGVAGAVKVAAQSSDAAALLHTKQWWLRPADAKKSSFAPTSYAVKSKRRQGDDLVVTLVGLTDRDQAQAMVGATIHLPRSAFPKPKANEFYWVDLIGCDVFNRDGVRLGAVLGLIDTGVHSVLRVGEAGATAAVDERLIPFVDAYVDKADPQARRVDVDWGLDF
jgi:16S rRNA processing protein RimM